MKTVQIDEVVYVCAMYVVRVIDGWQVRLPGQPTKFFGDGPHRGHEPAYLAAVEWRRSAMPITGQTRSLRAEENRQKKALTGQPGVFLTTSYGRKKALKGYSFQVRVPGYPVKTIYIGTLNTWQAKYEERLAKAITLARKLRRGSIQI